MILLPVVPVVPVGVAVAVVHLMVMGCIYVARHQHYLLFALLTLITLLTLNAQLINSLISRSAGG